jgi:hypothetical protein
MHLDRMIREWFRNLMSGGSAVVFPLSKMNILRDEGAGTLCFVVNYFVYLLARLHTFLD